jgi:uncharacterized protein
LREILKGQLESGVGNKVGSFFLAASSVSEMTLIAKVPGKGEIVGKVFKHLSPVTITKLKTAVPISGRVNFFEKNFAYILTDLVAGEEKAKKEFRRGEITFMPAGSMICFFLQDTRSYKPMNPLGTIAEGMSILESCRRGDLIRIESLT